MATGTQEPENFWEHTSDNSVIRTFLERTDFDVTEKFETLLMVEQLAKQSKKILLIMYSHLRNRIFGVYYILQDILRRWAVRIIYRKRFLRFQIMK